MLATVQANPEGIAVDSIVRTIHGDKPTPAQTESVRRAIRTLVRSDLVARTTRFETRERKSLKRYVDVAPCLDGFCPLCAERKRRVRLGDWHRRVMKSNASQDAAWLDDLKLAEASGFVHETVSSDRLVDDKPTTVDLCRLRLQIILPAPSTTKVR